MPATALVGAPLGCAQQPRLDALALQLCGECFGDAAAVAGLRTVDDRRERRRDRFRGGQGMNRVALRHVERIGLGLDCCACARHRPVPPGNAPGGDPK